MKRILLMLVAVVSCSHLLSQNLQRAVTDKVTVYFDGGLIEKHLEVSLKKGDNVLILDGNSPMIWNRSVQFEANDEFMLTDFDVLLVFDDNVISYEETLSPKDRIQYKKLNDTIAKLKEGLKEAKAYQAVLKKESATLSNLKLFSNPQSQDSLPAIKATMQYYRTKMSEITKEEMQNDKLIERINESLKEQEHLLVLLKEKYAYNLNPLGTKQTQSRIIANIYSGKDIPSALIKYSYVVSNVFWEPVYDMKLSSQDDDVRCVLKANLFNNSREDWLDVNLTFAGEEIHKDSQIGALQPSEIKNLANNNLRSASTMMKSKNAGFVYESERMVSTMEEEEVEEEMVYSIVDHASNYTAHTSSANGLMGQEYTVGHKHNIKSNTGYKTMPLSSSETNIAYKYIIKPKITQKAYLQALVCDWQKLGLTDAMAYVYFDNKISAQTSIAPSQTQTDTLLLSLGADKRVSVSRKVNKTTPKKSSMIGNTLETIVEINIQIKNNNLKDVELEIEDQVPISSDEKIKIQVLDLNGADYESLSGSLKWKKQLKAGETLNLKIKYSVLYPKDYVLKLD